MSNKAQEQLEKAGVFSLITRVGYGEKSLSGVGCPELLERLRNDDRFIEGILFGMHLDVGPDLTDLRSIRGSLGKGSLQVVISQVTFGLHADVDKYNPYPADDLWGTIGHTGELIGYLFGRIFGAKHPRSTIGVQTLQGSPDEPSPGSVYGRDHGGDLSCGGEARGERERQARLDRDEDRRRYHGQRRRRPQIQRQFQSRWLDRENVGTAYSGGDRGGDKLVSGGWLRDIIVGKFQDGPAKVTYPWITVLKYSDGSEGRIALWATDERDLMGLLRMNLPARDQQLVSVHSFREDL